MQIRELVSVGKYLSETIRKSNLVGLYQQLINAINKAAQNQTPSEVQSTLDALRRVHEEAENRVLSPAQNRLLEEYGAKKLLGRPAQQEIERILRKHQAHPQGLAKAFTGLMQRSSELSDKSSQLITVLEPLFSIIDDKEHDLQPGEGRIWLYFSENTAIKNIADLEKASETWKQIIHNFSRMPGASADGGRILQIQQKSPLEIELAANVALLAPLAFGINWLLGRIEHVIKILQEAEKLKQMKVDTKIIEALKKEAETHKEKIAENAANAIKEKFGADNEARNAAQQALTRVIKFIEGGGQLDIDIGRDVSNPATDPNEENVDLLSLIQSIREEMKQLPPPNTIDPSDKADGG